MLEVLIALGVFVMAITAAIQLFFGGQSLSVDSVNAILASDYVQEGIGAVRAIRDRGWAELTAGNHGLVFIDGQWQLSGASDSRDAFTRVVSIGPGADDNVKMATTTITWQTDPLRTQKIELVEQLTNWQNLLSGGCLGDPLSGNWQSPQVLGTADLGPGVSGTDVTVRLPYVFVSGVSSTASKHDIFVFDVSNPASPVLVKSLDIGSGGIESLYLQGNFLYAASKNDAKELIIFNNAGAPANLSEIGSYNLSGSTDGISVVAFASTTAIGRYDSAAYEIAFLNVTYPSEPALINEIATGGDVHDFHATLDKLYAVSQQSDEDIWIFDISDALNPAPIGTYDIAGTTEDLSVYGLIKNDTFNLLVGNDSNELLTIGATTTDQTYVRDLINIGGDINDIVCSRGDLVFLSTGNSNKEFVIVNVADPDNLVEYANLNFPQVATGVDYAENKVFVSLRSNDALKIITSQ